MSTPTINDAIANAVNELAPLYDLEGQSSHVAVIIQKHVAPLLSAAIARAEKLSAQIAAMGNSPCA